MVVTGHGFLFSMLDDSLLREFFTILLFASGPFSDEFVFGFQCLDWVQLDGLRALNSFSENTRRVGRPHVGLDESSLLRAQAIGNWRERAQDKFFWMNQFVYFFRSMTNDEREM